jgi:hypothetical protein
MERLVEQIAAGLEDGASMRTLVEELAADGVPRDTAAAMVTDIARLRQIEYRKAGLKHVVIGLGSIIAGVVLTLACSSLLEKIGFGLVFYGLVLVGAWEVLNGMRYLLFGAARKRVWVPIAVGVCAAIIFAVLRWAGVV